MPSHVCIGCNATFVKSNRVGQISFCRKCYFKDCHLVRKYGVGLVEYNKLRDAQGNRCAICDGSPSGRILAVDHCHKTGQVRGLLCHRCNSALGLLKENLCAMLAMVKYVEKYRRKLM